jgi:glycosyltransferase involved in cell wall biosynthesis
MRGLTRRYRRCWLHVATKAANQESVKIAVLIPCYNEELTVAQVVESFRAELPQAQIYVFDNNSTDRTVELGRAAGATVVPESRQGKGFVVQAMFRRVDADVYVMVDGDNAFPACEVHRLIEPIVKGEADMVVGSRLLPSTSSQFRPINRLANRLVLTLLNSMFRVQLTDVLSGYRAFSRGFVKTLPLFGGGFAIETELTIKAVARGFRIVEIPTSLTARPEGSHSKVRLFRDGFLILNTILALFRDYQPLTFFGVAGLFFLVMSVIPGGALLLEIAKHGAFARPILAVAAVGLFLAGLLSLAVGLVLHSIARRSQEFDYQLQVLGDELRVRVNRQPNDEQ